MKYILLAVLIVMTFVAGSVYGTHHYKQSCEVLGRNKPEWRECSL